MIELTDENFELQTSVGKVLVEFGATWCGVCKMIAPKMDEAEQQFTQYKFCAVDVDKCPYVTDNFKITHLPTIVILENGQEIKRGTFEILNHLGE